MEKKILEYLLQSAMSIAVGGEYDIKIYTKSGVFPSLELKPQYSRENNMVLLKYNLDYMLRLERGLHAIYKPACGVPRSDEPEKSMRVELWFGVTLSGWSPAIWSR